MLPNFNRILKIKYHIGELRIFYQFKDTDQHIKCLCTTNKSIDKKKFKLPKRYADSTTSVWVEYGQLALKYKPLNLGLGFSDFSCPSYITDALANVASSSNPLLHQYTRGFGHPRLIKALSELYSKEFNRKINQNTELLVSTGAYEALFCSIIGHVDDGDEVIIIEPFFDCYEPMVKAAGGVPKFIPLRESSACSKYSSSANYKLDTTELTALFNDKTKMIIINSPQNPLGKVFTEKELTVIAGLCKRWNVLCICDEVYEWVIFKPYKRARMANLPGMWERTITIGSAGKMFNITGWKIGWAFGPDYLIHNLFMVHQNCIYTCNTPIQEAIAISIEHELKRYNSPKSYLVTIAVHLQKKRDYLAKVLEEVGMRPILPQGGFFILADWSSIKCKVELASEKDKYADYRFTKWMTKSLGLQGIPATAFYSEPHKNIGEYFVRYCYFKKQETLEKAAEILKQWKVKN